MKRSKARARKRGRHHHDLGVVKKFLGVLGDDPSREGLQETPLRVLKAWKEWTSGYNKDPVKILKTFVDGSENYDELLFEGNIAFFSHCVVGSTFVETPRGRVPIQYLKHNDWVYSINSETYEIVLVKCQHPRVTRKQAQLVRVYADNDSVLCTPDHKFLTFNRGWVQAQNLKPGDSVASFYRTTNYEAGIEPHVNLVTRKHRKQRSKEQSQDKKYSVKFMGTTGTPVAEHRFVWWSIFGDWFKRKPIHHKNEKRWDNDPSNLEPMSTGEHNRIHNRTLKLAHNENRKAAAAESSGRPEVRAKRAKSVKAHWDKIKLDEETYFDRCKNMGRGIAASKNHVVFGVENVPWKEDVWCMDVPGTQTFFANGMAVHNCEHHLTSFFGEAYIGYIPNGKVVGLSKLGRLVDVFAQRLTIQERITTQIADALNTILEPKAVGVVLRARHLCMESRGVRKVGTVTMSAAMHGAFKDESAARAEFLTYVKIAEGKSTI